MLVADYTVWRSADNLGRAEVSSEWRTLPRQNYFLFIFFPHKSTFNIYDMQDPFRDDYLSQFR